MLTSLREINLVDPRLCIFLCPENRGVDTVACLIQIGNDSLFHAFRGTNTVPNDVKPRVADNLSQKDYNFRCPDFYGGDDSRLAHTGNTFNSFTLVKMDARAKSTL